MPTDRRAGRVDYLGLGFDPLTLDQACDWAARRGADTAFGYVVTPNVDHVLRVHADPALAPLYDGAALCLNDSRVLGRLAARAGVALPVAPGSDLTPAVLTTVARAGDRVAIVGGDQHLHAALGERLPALDLRFVAAPFGLAQDAAARTRVVEAIEAVGARFVMLGLGSPQQELIAAELLARGRASGTAFCIGASLEFVTGAKARAPGWVQRLSLEWAWRLLSEPRRLARRYLVDAPRIFPLARAWRRDRQSALPPR